MEAWKHIVKYLPINSIHELLLCNKSFLLNISKFIYPYYPKFYMFHFADFLTISEIYADFSNKKITRDTFGVEKVFVRHIGNIYYSTKSEMARSIQVLIYDSFRAFFIFTKDIIRKMIHNYIDHGKLLLNISLNNSEEIKAIRFIIKNEFICMGLSKFIKYDAGQKSFVKNAEFDVIYKFLRKLPRKNKSYYITCRGISKYISVIENICEKMFFLDNCFDCNVSYSNNKVKIKISKKKGLN